MVLRKVDEEQGIVEYGYGQRNVCQYDLLGFYDDVLIASLWQDQDNEWHLTKRLYGMDTVEDLGEYHCEFQEVVSDFIDVVTEWLNDEIAYLRDMYDDLAEEDIPIKE